MLSAEEVAVCLVLLEEDEVEVAKTKRRAGFWIHNIIPYRTLFPDLTENDEAFFHYFRLSHDEFDAFLKNLRYEMLRETKKFREQRN